MRRMAPRGQPGWLLKSVTALVASGAGLAAAACQAQAAPGAAHAGSRAPGTITTVAGGAGGPAPATSLPLTVCGIAYADGALYVGDAATVRRIDMRTGWLTTPAGDGAAGQWGDGGLATNAEIQGAGPPVGYSCGGLALAVDSHRNLVISGNSVWVVAASDGEHYGRPMTAGHIYTIPAHLTTWPVSIQVDRAGNVLFASTDYSACGSEQCYGSTPGLVDVLAESSGAFYGRPMRAGRMYRVAGSETATRPGNNGPAAGAALGTLNQISLDAAGNLLIADGGNPASSGMPALPAQIRVVAASDGTFYGRAMKAGDIYAIAGGGRLTADGVPATSASINALGVAQDPHGNVVIGDGSRLRVVAARGGRFYGIQMIAGRIYTVAGNARGGYVSSGNGGPALRARIAAGLVAVDGAGDLAFADQNNSTVRVVAARAGVFYGIAMKAGHVYAAAGKPTPAGSPGSFGLGGPAVRALLPDYPIGVAADPYGDLVIGFVNSGPAFVPARKGRYFGVRMRAGEIYLIPTDASALSACAGPVAADRHGNVLIADRARHLVLVAPARSGTFYGRRMRAGRIYPVAGTGSAASSGDGGPALAAGLNPLRVAADRHGDLYVVDNPAGPGANSHRIRMIPARTGVYFGMPMKAGDIYTVAGNGRHSVANAVPATRSGMDPNAVAVDRAGNLVLATDNRIRVVAARTGRLYGVAMKTGYIYTLAGPFPGAHDVAIDRRGDILLDDAAANVVRMLAVRSGEVYGQRVTTGRMYVVAGRSHGRAGLGEGGPATMAWLDNPEAIAVDPAGRLLIADDAGQRIRAVLP